MVEFNLIDEPWIPCIDLNNNSKEYGISDVLIKAHEIKEICDDSPLVTLSIHRLLLAILYRAFKGPANYREWRELYKAGIFKNSNVLSYLEKWNDRFDLISEEYPFYQMANFKTNKPISVNRLATEIASGNNVTLFDHGSDELEMEWSFASTARYLVACQSFALGFGKSSNAMINGTEEPVPYSSDAIALRGMNIFLQGDDLFETFMINLIPIDDTSQPPWEMKDPHLYRDTFDGKTRKVHTSFGIVDRLTWQSRLAKLIPDGDTVSKMYFTQGRSADKSSDDPMKVYRTSREEGIFPLSLSSTKAAWRDAHSILAITSSESNEHRPECYNLVENEKNSGAIGDSRVFVTNIIGLAAAPNKAAKFLIWRHEKLPIPATLFGNIDLIDQLGLLITNAENAASELRTRVWRIGKLYLALDGDKPGVRQPDRVDITRIADSIDPRSAYWSRLENRFYLLIENLPDDWDTTAEEWKPDDQMNATNTWRENIKHEAQRSLEESIRSLGTTARAIQAVARVSMDFYDTDLGLKQSMKQNMEKGGIE